MSVAFRPTRDCAVTWTADTERLRGQGVSFLSTGLSSVLGMGPWFGPRTTMQGKRPLWRARLSSCPCPLLRIEAVVTIGGRASNEGRAPRASAGPPVCRYRRGRASTLRK